MFILYGNDPFLKAKHINPTVHISLSYVYKFYLYKHSGGSNLIISILFSSLIIIPFKFTNLTIYLSS